MCVSQLSITITNTWCNQPIDGKDYLGPLLLDLGLGKDIAGGKVQEDAYLMVTTWMEVVREGAEFHTAFKGMPLMT